MSKFPSQEMDRFNVRLPSGMREAIAERAKANGRSMNSEIVQILQDALNGPVAEEAFTTLMAKMANWYEGIAPVIEHVKDMDDEELKKFADKISKKKPT